MLLTACSAQSTYYVTLTPDTPCPGEPCHTLSEYVAGQYLHQNSTLIFLPGDHTLKRTMSVTNFKTKSLTLHGSSSSLPEITSRIVCIWPAGFVFRDITKLHITALAFISCGHKYSAAVDIAFIQRVTISNCIFQNNTSISGRGGAVYVYESTLNATENIFQDNSATTGAALYIRSIDFKTAMHTFIGNIFQSNHATSGGSLFGDIKYSTLTFINNKFQNNWADSIGGTILLYLENLILIFISNEFQNNYALEVGGVFAIMGNKYITLTLKGNIFQNNSANIGGVLYAGLGTSGFIHSTLGLFERFQSKNALELGGVSAIVGDKILSLTFKGNIFQNNFAGSGGVLYAGYGNYTIISNTFHNNLAAEQGGALHLSFSSTALNNNTFISNTAQFGGVIFVVAPKVHESGVYNVKMHGRNIIGHNTAQYGGGIFSINCNLELEEDSIIENNVAIFGGGLYVHNVKSAKISGDAVFTGNSATLGGGGIYASLSTFNVTGNLTIVNNSAADGGGLLFVGDSEFYLQSNTIVNFRCNSAERKGGAIKVEESNPLTYCIDHSTAIHDCFFQLPTLAIDSMEDLNITVCFQNNTAEWAGADMYGGLVDACNLKYTELSTPSKIFDNFITSENKVDVTSNPLETCACTSTRISCTGSFHSKPVYPGGTLEVPVIARGHRNGTTSAVIQVIHGNITSTTPQNTNNSCTVLRFTVHSFAEGTTQEMTLYAEGPCPPSEKNTLRVYVEILPCPPGFQLSQTQPVCICTERLQRFTNTCVIDSKIISRRKFAEFWVGYDTNSGLILHPHCPLDYCLSEAIHLVVNDSDKQCNYNRSGLLCGRCSEKLSLVLGSNHCKQCSNSSLALLLAFLFAGIALVLLLLVLRLTVAAGTINGLVFYANIVGVNSAIFFQPKTTNVLSVFIAWLNLDLGIETCFYNGMDAYAKTWLQFMFPFYVWALVGMIILGSHYSGRVAKVFGSNPVAVLSTLFLLSYAKLLRLVFAALSYTSLEYPNNSHTAVWLYDGNIKYLGSKHAPLFIAAMVCLIFLFVPYTIVLIFSQWLWKFKVFSWTNSNKIKPFLDAYHAPYTDKHRYWTGLMLLLRFVLFLISAVNVLGDPSTNLLATAFVSVAILTFPTVLGARIYKGRCLNVLEISFLLNLNILTGASYHIRLTKGNQNAATFTSVSIALTTFTGIVIYHCIQQMKATRLWQRTLSLKHAYAPKRVCINSGPEDPPDAVFISGSAPTQTVVEICYHELREPCMATD